MAKGHSSDAQHSCTGKYFCFAVFASAHPGHEGAGFVHGLLHPLGGLDHILAMVAVGLFAAQLGGRAVRRKGTAA